MLASHADELQTHINYHGVVSLYNHQKVICSVVYLRNEHLWPPAYSEARLCYTKVRLSVCSSVYMYV